MAKRPTVIDLFSGCGGMSLGFEAAGFDVAASVEYDAIHSAVHHVNFPYSATICKDISQVTKEEIYKKLNEKGFNKEIDVVVGGPPCQGFSLIGKRVLSDPRNRLVFEYHRIVKEFTPKYFVFENVPGIASGQHKTFLIKLIKEFKKIGYSVVDPYKILDSSTFGVPQKRRRLILLGYRSDMKAPVYPQLTHREESHKEPGLHCFTSNCIGSGEAISDLAKIEVFIGEDLGIDARKKKYTGYKSSFDFKPNGYYSLCHRRDIERRIWGHVGSNHTEYSIQRFSNTEPGETEKISRFFKLHPDKPCNTLRAGTGSDKGAYTAPRPIHYSAPRCITIREAARLHGFPDWFQFHRTIWHGFREIGNAVVPLVAKCVGDELIRCLGVDTSNIEMKTIGGAESQLLTYNMGQASSYWGIPNNVIPKRKRLVG